MIVQPATSNGNGTRRPPPCWWIIECKRLRRTTAERRMKVDPVASVRQRARPSRQPLRGDPELKFGVGLDRLRSLPQSVAMIDTSVRGNSVPRTPTRRPRALAHCTTVGPGRRASRWVGKVREGSSRAKRCRSWRDLRQRAEAVKAAANFRSRHREAVALTAEHAAARSPPDRPSPPAAAWRM